MNALAQFFAEYSDLLIEGVRDTIVMTAVATLLAYVIGLPIGVLLISVFGSAWLLDRYVSL